MTGRNYQHLQADDGAKYMPSLEEIAREAALIRAGWSEHELRRREGTLAVQSVGDLQPINDPGYHFRRKKPAT